MPPCANVVQTDGQHSRQTAYGMSIYVAAEGMILTIKCNTGKWLSTMKLTCDQTLQQCRQYDDNTQSVYFIYASHSFEIRQIDDTFE